MRTTTDSKGRPVTDLEYMHNGDGTAYIVSAVYNDTPKDQASEAVPEDELIYLTDAYQDLCDQYVYESCIMAAEIYYEGDR